MSYHPHPLCLMLPEMSDDEFTSLKKDIAAKGLLHPIMLYEGKILDGRHRYRACIETDTDPRFDTYIGSDAAGFVWSENGARRNLTKSQRAMVAAGFLEYEREQARKRMQTAGAIGGMSKGCENLPTPSKARAADKAGERLGVSGRYVSDAEKVIKAGAPELVDKVRAGVITINTARDLVTLNKDAQRRIAAAETEQERHMLIIHAKARSQSCKRRDDPDKPIVEHHGTPFLRKWLSAMERIAIVLAEVDLKDCDDIVRRFEEDMDWDSDVLSAQFDRCVDVIEAMHKIHIRHGKKSKPKLKVV